ncbi:MAG TPA: PD-(D/E)XK nuclease family protein [Candidatus Methylacidiphilales bacterium]|nr:PD-(D/E)XK nuclease family protein [Candidatus Methylacidiphilales bacterium]
MDSNRALPPEIEQALARGWTILTANQRAARTLRRDFDLRQRALNLAYWQPPPILAWDTWLNGLWRSLLLSGRASDLLLSAIQERTLWRDLIAAEVAAASLQAADALAQTAADAWLLLHNDRGRRRLDSYEGNSDTRTFGRWAAEFEKRCRSNRYLTQAQLPESLVTAITAAQLALPTGLLLVGFDSQTPAQIALLQVIRDAGADVAELEPQSWGGDSKFEPAPDGNLTLASAPDEHTELAACAGWLRARLTQQLEARIAVIVPAIEPARAEIDRVFRQALAPELNDIAAPVASSPYEFSLGVPLATTPLTATALDLLRWAVGPLALDRVSALLLSRHFAVDEAEVLSRAEFDAFVLRDRHLLQPRISLDSLAALVSHPSRRLPVLLNHLRALSTLVRRLDLAAERTHADWVATIGKLLEAAGWAPPALLDSVEFQTRRKWESTLDELATLDFAGVRVRFTDALAALARIAAETLFAPESRHAPVQIMGPLESAGSSFDAIWFLRANDQAWPARTAPNPLLPWQLQRDLGMPGATPSVDAAHARRITERIALSAPAIVFSYAEASIEGPQRRSPVLGGLALEPWRIAPPGSSPAPVALDTFADEAPIPAPPDRVHQGGAAILQSQAACGFRAFAEKRLYSSALEAPSLGLDSSERGSLVHAVLEGFWIEVKTQAALLGITRTDRDAQLARSIDAALAEHYARPEPGWPRAYLNAERDRLLILLGQWLDYEATERGPFTVQSLEEKLDDVSIGPLRLAVRVDRVDLAQVEGNTGQPASEIILDYKTGLAKPADWLGPRPDAPQLPLYAVVAGKANLAAVAFASVRPGNLMGIAGYEALPGVLPNASKLKTSSLAAQVDEWRAVLTALANEFHAGNASVSPKHYPQTCEYCEQRLLCRLNPATLDPDVLEEEIEDEPDPFSGLEEDEFV